MAGIKWSYLKELIDFHLAGGIDVNSLDGRANLVVGLTLTNLLNDLYQVLLINLAASIHVETARVNPQEPRRKRRQGDE